MNVPPAGKSGVFPSLRRELVSAGVRDDQISNDDWDRVHGAKDSITFADILSADQVFKETPVRSFGAGATLELGSRDPFSD